MASEAKGWPLLRANILMLKTLFHSSRVEMKGRLNTSPLFFIHLHTWILPISYHSVPKVENHLKFEKTCLQIKPFSYSFTHILQLYGDYKVVERDLGCPGPNLRANSQSISNWHWISNYIYKLWSNYTKCLQHKCPRGSQRNFAVPVNIFWRKIEWCPLTKYWRRLSSVRHGDVLR